MYNATAAIVESMFAVIKLGPQTTPRVRLFTSLAKPTGPPNPPAKQRDSANPCSKCLTAKMRGPWLGTPFAGPEELGDTRESP
jgi:hypothetical protein